MRLFRLSANQPEFHTLEFQPGFNMIVAERTKESTKKDSRNGLGKSTAIDILNFCLGRGGGRNQVPVVEDLNGWSFALDVELFGSKVTLTRSVEDPKRLTVTGETSQWPVEPTWDEKAGAFYISASELSAVLAHEFFGLGSEEASAKYSPTIGSLLAYFMRRGAAAYNEPFTHHPKQAEWDKQVNVAFLLGLHWQDASAWQELKDEKKGLDQLARAARDGVLEDFLGSEGALETERVRLAGEITAEEERLQRFRVHEDYRSIETETTRLTETLHRLANANFSDRQAIELYEESGEDETAVGLSGAEVEAVFEEAGMVFPEAISRRLEEIAEFHDTVVSNRREYLTNEIARLQRASEQRDQEISALDQRRAGLMEVLRTHGALDEFQQLQKRLSEARAQLAEVEARIERLQEIAEAKRRYRENLRALEAEAATRFDELRDQRDEAIRHFNSDTEALYEAPGRLLIDLTSTGFRFGVEIDRARSTGVGHMKIYCFDLTLMQLWANRSPSPGFLIHDSLLYDGVDERQKALALDLAAKECERLGWQYICAFNTDELPKELPSDSPANIEPIVTLTDARDDGMLLGRRFE
jgi:uncharacterized protein YydD (DUF2326 family)